MGHPLPTRDELLDAWVETNGDPDALSARFKLPASRLLPLLKQPDLADDIAAWDQLRDRARRLHAFDRQRAAADALRDLLKESDNPFERRRAATVLARITIAALRGAIARTPSPSPPPTDPHGTPYDAPEAAPAQAPAPIPEPKPFGSLLAQLAARTEPTRPPNRPP